MENCHPSRGEKMGVTLPQTVSLLGWEFDILQKFYFENTLSSYGIAAYRILLPSELTIAMKAFCDRIGLTDLARNFIMNEENNIEPSEGFMT
jgi:hypothetical protein